MLKILNCFEKFLGEMIDIFSNFVKSNVKGLYIGINYRGTSNQLNGCIRDAMNVKSFFETYYGVHDTLLMTDDTPIKPTKANILKQLQILLQNATSGDILFVSYSGHGLQRKDKFDKDEKDDMDECILSLDEKIIYDDEIHNVLTKYLSENVSIFFLMDCCNSETNLDLEYALGETLSNTKKSKKSFPKGLIVSISGSNDDKLAFETQIDGKIQGALTTQVLRELKKPEFLWNTSEKSWNLLLERLRHVLENSVYPQTPFISGNRVPSDIPFINQWKNHFDRIPKPKTIKTVGFSFVNQIPHIPNSFTQSLVFWNTNNKSYLLEGTDTLLRLIDVTTGEEVANIALNPTFTGGGIVLFSDALSKKNIVVQLTQKEETAFFWEMNENAVSRKDKNQIFTFKKTLPFQTLKKDGLGMTYDTDTNELIVSDGSDFLFFWDPKTLQEKKRLKIQGWDLKTKGTLSSLNGLNKLEYINGRIWANVISSNIIYEIDLRTGFVTKSLDLSSIVPLENKGSILSGFAYNNQKDILHVTGKNWPYIIGIRIDF